MGMSSRSTKLTGYPIKLLTGTACTGECSACRLCQEARAWYSMVSLPDASSMAVSTCRLATPPGPCHATHMCSSQARQAAQVHDAACVVHKNIWQVKPAGIQVRQHSGAHGRQKQYLAAQRNRYMQMGDKTLPTHNPAHNAARTLLTPCTQERHACSAVSSWKCVAKSVGQPISRMRCSEIAHARPKPSYVLVPRPSSSMITRLRALAPCAKKGFQGFHDKQDSSAHHAKAPRTPGTGASQHFQRCKPSERQPSTAFQPHGWKCRAAGLGLKTYAS